MGKDLGALVGFALLLVFSFRVNMCALCVSLSVMSDSLPPLPGSSVHAILQARIMEWIAIPFFRVSSLPRDRTWAFCTAGRFLPSELQERGGERG